MLEQQIKEASNITDTTGVEASLEVLGQDISVSVRGPLDNRNFWYTGRAEPQGILLSSGNYVQANAAMTPEHTLRHVYARAISEAVESMIRNNIGGRGSRHE